MIGELERLHTPHVYSNNSSVHIEFIVLSLCCPLASLLYQSSIIPIIDTQLVYSVSLTTDDANICSLLQSIVEYYQYTSTQCLLIDTTYCSNVSYKMNDIPPPRVTLSYKLRQPS